MQLLVAQAHLFKQPGVLDGTRSQVGIRLEQKQLLFRKMLRTIIRHHQASGELFSRKQWEDSQSLLRFLRQSRLASQAGVW